MNLIQAKAGWDRLEAKQGKAFSNAERHRPHVNNQPPIGKHWWRFNYWMNVGQKWQDKAIDFSQQIHNKDLGDYPLATRNEL